MLSKSINRSSNLRRPAKSLEDTMRKRIGLVMIAFLLVAGCRAAQAPGETVSQGTTDQSQLRYIKDDTHKVGCWIFIDGSGASVSCLPYEQYTP